MAYIDRFGAAAVYGRALGVHEMRCLQAAENVSIATLAQTKAPGGMATWNETHPQAAALIHRAASAALEMGLIKNDG